VKISTSTPSEPGQPLGDLDDVHVHAGPRVAGARGCSRRGTCAPRWVAIAPRGVGHSATIFFPPESHQNVNVQLLRVGSSSPSAWAETVFAGGWGVMQVIGKRDRRHAEHRGGHGCVQPEDSCARATARRLVAEGFPRRRRRRGAPTGWRRWSRRIGDGPPSGRGECDVTIRRVVWRGLADAVAGLGGRGHAAGQQRRRRPRGLDPIPVSTASIDDWQWQWMYDVKRTRHPRGSPRRLLPGARGEAAPGSIVTVGLDRRVPRSTRAAARLRPRPSTPQGAPGRHAAPGDRRQAWLRVIEIGPGHGAHRRVLAQPLRRLTEAAATRDRRGRR